MKIVRILGFLAVLTLLIGFVVAPAEVQALSDLPILHQLGLVGSGSSMLGMCVSLGSIKAKCGANVGGTSELYVINKGDIDETQWPALLEDGVTLNGPIVPKAGKGFAKWDFVQDTGDFNFTLSGEIGSQAFEHSIGCYIARFNPEIAKIYNQLPNSELIAIKVDGNGQQIVFGDLKRPLSPKLDYKSGKKFNEKNGAEFGLACGNNHVPYFHPGAIPVLEVVEAPVA